MNVAIRSLSFELGGLSDSPFGSAGRPRSGSGCGLRIGYEHVGTAARAGGLAAAIEGGC